MNVMLFSLYVLYHMQNKFMFCMYAYKGEETPVKAQRVSGCLGSQISRQFAREGDKVASTVHRPPIPSRKYS